MTASFAARLFAILSFAVSFARADEAPPAPTPMSLWPDKPPKFAENATAEVVTKNGGGFENISVPGLSVYLPPKEVNTGMALIICPGGGYRALDWTTHVVYAAQYFLPRGFAVIGLKYRTNPPNPITKEDRSIPLLDAKRAVRTVRSHAAEWGIDPQKIGVVGYSAGANLAVTLASQFDEGDPQAGDSIEKLSSRPDFVVGCATWHWHQKTSPFTFSKNTPPVFFVHATNDGVENEQGRIGGAPIDLPYAVKKQLEELGVPVKMDVYEEGAHGVGNLIPQRVKNGFPPTKWPEHLLEWLGKLEPRFQSGANP